MKYIAKTPTFDAVRFSGVSSLAEIKALCLWRSVRYEESISRCELSIQLDKDEATYKVMRGDYVVVEIVAGSRRVTIVPEDEFEDKYEPLPAVNKPGPIIARGANPMGYAQDANPINLCGQPAIARGANQQHALLDPAVSHPSEIVGFPQATHPGQRAEMRHPTKMEGV